MIITKNKKAFFDYKILETFQAGISMSSKLVKEFRSKRVNLLGKYIVFQNKQLQILELGNEKHTENTPLLLKKKELNKILKELDKPGITCVPLSIKTVGRWIKAEIALVKGKKEYDKREVIKNRDLDREMKRENLDKYSKD